MLSKLKGLVVIQFLEDPPCKVQGKWKVHGNCCTHITRLRFLVELTQVMQKFGQDFCPGLTPSSHQALAATCSFPHQWDRREKWKGESWTTRGLREGQFNRESRSCAHKQRKPRKSFRLPAGRQVFSTSRRAGPQYR